MEVPTRHSSEAVTSPKKCILTELSRAKRVKLVLVTHVIRLIMMG